MVSPSRWLVPVSVLILVVASAVGLGIESNDSVPATENPEAPLDETPSAPADPPDLAFSGFITFSDPSRHALGPEPILWSESCHRLDLQDAVYRHATLALIAGASDGVFEDLDLYAYTADHARLQTADNETSGIGIHHDIELADDTAYLITCLAGGGRAEYHVDVF